MFCENCGTKLEDGALFCSECGNVVEQTTSNEVKSQTPVEEPEKLGTEEALGVIPDASLGTSENLDTEETLVRISDDEKQKLLSLRSNSKKTNKKEKRKKERKHDKSLNGDKQIKKHDNKKICIIIITVIVAIVGVATAFSYAYTLRNNKYDKFSENWENVVTEEVSSEETTTEIVTE